MENHKINDRQLLCLYGIIYMAIDHIRELLEEGKVEQALELAKVARGIPLFMVIPGMYFTGLEDKIEEFKLYQSNYPEGSIDFSNLIRKIKDNPLTC